VLASYLETVWRALRNGAPLPLSHRQATALVGELYRAWALGEGREDAASDSVTLDRVTSKVMKPSGDDDESMENVPALWETARRFLDRVGVADKPWTLERTFGPLIDRLLLAKGIYRVDPASREMVMTAFHLALRDAFEARERNAEGDYRPDPKAERFPAFEQAPIKLPSSPPVYEASEIQELTHGPTRGLVGGGGGWRPDDQHTRELRSHDTPVRGLPTP
jgi:hypothetical protein